MQIFLVSNILILAPIRIFLIPWFLGKNLYVINAGFFQFPCIIQNTFLIFKTSNTTYYCTRFSFPFNSFPHHFSSLIFLLYILNFTCTLFHGFNIWFFNLNNSKIATSRPIFKFNTLFGNLISNQKLVFNCPLICLRVFHFCFFTSLSLIFFYVNLKLALKSLISNDNWSWRLFIFFMFNLLDFYVVFMSMKSFFLVISMSDWPSSLYSKFSKFLATFLALSGVDMVALLSCAEVDHKAIFGKDIYLLEGLDMF